MWLLSHKPVQRPFINSVGCFHHFHHQLGNRLPFRFWVASQKLCFFISCTQRASNDISFHIFTYKGNDCVAIDVVISYAKYSTLLSFFARVVDLRLARNIHSHYVRKTLFVRMPFSFRLNWAPRVLSMVECEHYEQNERGYFSVWIWMSCHYLVAYTFSFSISWGYIPIVCFHVEHNICEHILHTAESAIILALLLWIYHLHHMLMHYIIHSTKPLSSFYFALLHSTDNAMFVVRCTAYECEWGWRVHFSQPVATFRKLPSLITVAYVAMHMNFWSFRNFFFLRRNYLFLWGFNFTFFCMLK